MASKWIDRSFYNAILDFDKNQEAQEYYYSIMNMETGRAGADGRPEIVRDQILRVYAVLFCEDTDRVPTAAAGLDDVLRTADRLYVGEVGLDPQHWYRMRYHFPVIDEDNYERFAALVIADLKAGSLHDAIVNGGDMLLVGEVDPLHKTKEQRQNQHVTTVDFPGGEVDA